MLYRIVVCTGISVFFFFLGGGQIFFFPVLIFVKFPNLIWLQKQPNNFIFGFLKRGC